MQSDQCAGLRALGQRSAGHDAARWQIEIASLQIMSEALKSSDGLSDIILSIMAKPSCVLH